MVLLLLLLLLLVWMPPSLLISASLLTVEKLVWVVEQDLGIRFELVENVVQISDSGIRHLSIVGLDACWVVFKKAQIVA